MQKQFTLMFEFTMTKCCVSTHQHHGMRSTMATLIWQMCTLYACRRCAIISRATPERPENTKNLQHTHSVSVENVCVSVRNRTLPKPKTTVWCPQWILSMPWSRIAHWHRWVFAILSDTCLLIHLHRTQWCQSIRDHWQIHLIRVGEFTPGYLNTQTIVCRASVKCYRMRCTHTPTTDTQ